MKRALRQMIFPLMAAMLIYDFYNPSIDVDNKVIFEWIFEVYLSIATLMMGVFVLYCGFIKLTTNKKAKMENNPHLWEKLDSMINYLDKQAAALKPKTTFEGYFNVFVMVSLMVTSFIMIVNVKDYSAGILLSMFTVMFMFMAEYNIKGKIIEPSRKMIYKFRKNYKGKGNDFINQKKQNMAAKR